MGIRSTYEDIESLFTGKGCRLLTTKQEYNDRGLTKQDQFHYVAMCGHNHHVRITNFMNGSGILCKRCALVNGIVHRKQNECTGNTQVIKQFTDLLDSQVEWKLTPDKHSVSDIFIKPRTFQEDEWVRVLIRTSKIDPVLRFRIASHYRNYILVCMSDEDCWVIPSKQNHDNQCIRITSKNRDVYKQFWVTTQPHPCASLCPTLINLYWSVAKIYDPTIKTVHKTPFLPENTLTYKSVNERIMKEKCILLTTKTEYESQACDTKAKLEIVMACGHKLSTSLNLFQKRKHKLCKNCINDYVKHTAYDRLNAASSSCVLESIAFQYVSKLIENTFDVLKTHEGCRADMAIRLKSVHHDEWVGVQLKVRSSNTVQYSFSHLGNYDGQAILCIAWPIKKIWIFNGSDCNSQGTSNISIGKIRSKYDKHLIKQESVSDWLVSFYHESTKVCIEHLMNPISEGHKKEHANRKYREAKLSQHIQISYPSIDGSKHDVVLNGYKIQDKTAQKVKQDSWRARLNGYCKGDNDYYWIIKPTGGIYVLPENMVIRSDGTSVTSLALNKKMDDYYYNLENEYDVLKLVELFAKEKPCESA
jgi:hypothetical protein